MLLAPNSLLNASISFPLCSHRSGASLRNLAWNEPAAAIASSPKLNASAVAVIAVIVFELKCLNNYCLSVSHLPSSCALAIAVSIRGLLLSITLPLTVFGNRAEVGLASGF